jgi:acetyltransferase-like isoleucine patch superfamily enzyme
MTGVSRLNGARAIGALRRARAIAYTCLLASSFESFGSGSLIEPPLMLNGSERIAVARNVHIGLHSWLLALEPESRLSIGEGSVLTGFNVISALNRIDIGAKVLFARNVYVADHNHGTSTPGVPVVDQPLEDVAAVSIGDGAWLGQNVVVLPGATIGAGAVVGANSVVLGEVPAHHVAVGAPARVVKDLRTAGGS